MKNILLLRSADVTTVFKAIGTIKSEFPDSNIHVLTQKNYVTILKDAIDGVNILEYPYRDFNLSVPDDFFNSLPDMDIALSLYKNEGLGYEEVDSFLYKINAEQYGAVYGNMELKFTSLSPSEKQITWDENIKRLYVDDEFRQKSIAFSDEYCPKTSKVVFTGNCRIIIEEGGRFEIDPYSILRMGYVPSEWAGIRLPGETVIRIHSGAVFRCQGSVTLYSGIKMNVMPDAELSIGDGSYIAFNTKLFVEKKIEIGKNCAISWDVEFMDTNFHRMSVSDSEVKKAAIKLNDHVWIGAGVRVLKDVELGRNSVVAASSVVAKSFPENSIIAGNPAKSIGTKEGEYRV